jgi:short-subunit dehydrogenase
MNASTKYALITGASSGIGWHISIELAKRGYPIIAVSNQPEKLDILKKELVEAFLITVHPFHIDLSHPGAGKQVFEYCEKNQLEVEVLVNNAGMLVIGEAIAVDYSRAAAILQLHVNTPALLCQLFGKKMAERKSGFILNVSSISAVMPYPIISFYGPSKVFIRSFTRALRTEMMGQGIKVTCLIPGATATPLYDTYDVNVPLAMKLGVMKKPETVAHAGVNALFNGRSECIPGILNKVVVFIFPLIPAFVINWIYRLRLHRQKKRLPSP